MKKQSYIHIASDINNRVVFVKVTAYHDKASFQVLDKALIKLGHNKFTLISYPFELKKRLTKPFKGLLDMHHLSDYGTREFLKEFIADRDL